jgi:hypothetical protein
MVCAAAAAQVVGAVVMLVVVPERAGDAAVVAAPAALAAEAETAPAPSDDAARSVATTPPVDDARVEPDAAGEQAASVALESESSTSVSLGTELATLLESFRGTEPRLDELNQHVRELGEGARVVEDAVQREGEVVRGELALEGVTERASFVVDSGQARIQIPVTLPATLATGVFAPSGETSGPSASISVTFRPDPDGEFAYGWIGVKHTFDHSSPELGAAPTVVGWIASTERATGTELEPILCARTPEEAIRVGRFPEVRDQYVQQRPWDWDLGKLAGWHSALAPYFGE